MQVIQTSLDFIVLVWPKHLFVESCSKLSLCALRPPCVAFQHDTEELGESLPC